MKNDPELAKRVMANVENFITTYTATSVRPGRVCSWLISLDENGEIEKYRVTGGGGNISGPTEEEQRQFEAEQAAKKKRREEYARLNEESALKRRLMEQEADERYYKDSMTKKAVSIAAYRPPRSGRWPGAPRPHRRKPQYIRPGCTSSKSRAS